HELPRLILEHRGLAKLKSTYTDKLPLMVNSKTKRVHTSYHQAVTATGRLSSRDPNLQNIPVRNEEGRRIRQAFIARDGFKIVAADYSQIELRIMAHLSQDKGLLDAFAQGKDIHRATASEVFGIPLDEVTAEQRRSAKAINFGLIYGMSAFGLSQQIGVERKEAQRYMDLYFERYPG
ncbi:DNA polymerase I, partial [Klebsiella oxytoca]